MINMLSMRTRVAGLLLAAMAGAGVLSMAAGGHQGLADSDSTDVVVTVSDTPTVSDDGTAPTDAPSADPTSAPSDAPSADPTTSPTDSPTDPGVYSAMNSSWD